MDRQLNLRSCIPRNYIKLYVLQLFPLRGLIAIMLGALGMVFLRLQQTSDLTDQSLLFIGELYPINIRSSITSIRPKISIGL